MNRRDLIKGLAALPLTSLLPNSGYIEASPDRNWQFGGPMMFHNIVLHNEDDLKNIYKMYHPNTLKIWGKDPIPIWPNKNPKYEQGLQILTAGITEGNYPNYSWTLHNIAYKPEKYSCKLNDNDNKYCIEFLPKLFKYEEFKEQITGLNLRFYHTPYIGEFVHTPNGYGIIGWPDCVCLVDEG